MHGPIQKVMVKLEKSTDKFDKPSSKSSSMNSHNMFFTSS